jgi:hypothetical protein
MLGKPPVQGATGAPGAQQKAREPPVGQPEVAAEVGSLAGAAGAAVCQDWVQGSLVEAPWMKLAGSQHAVEDLQGVEILVESRR